MPPSSFRFPFVDVFNRFKIRRPAVAATVLATATVLAHVSLTRKGRVIASSLLISFLQSWRRCRWFKFRFVANVSRCQRSDANHFTVACDVSFLVFTM